MFRAMSVQVEANPTEHRRLSWLTGMLWADVGAVTGLALCLSLNFPLARHHGGEEWLALVVLTLAAGTAGTAMINRQAVQRAATREITVAAITDLYSLSYEIQRLLSELSIARKADRLEHPVDLSAIEAALANVDGQTRRLQRPRFPDRGVSDLLWQAGRAAGDACSTSLVSARLVPFRNADQRPAIWTDASQFARKALVIVGQAIERLQKTL